MATRFRLKRKTCSAIGESLSTGFGSLASGIGNVASSGIGKVAGGIAGAKYLGGALEDLTGSKIAGKALGFLAGSKITDATGKGLQDLGNNLKSY